jgi:hypothetical protein
MSHQKASEYTTQSSLGFIPANGALLFDNPAYSKLPCLGEHPLVELSVRTESYISVVSER